MVRKFFGIGFALVGILFTALAWGGHFQAQRISEQGSRVMAVVSGKSKHASSQRERNARYEISYVFSLDNGAPINGKYSIASGVWENLSEGALIEVAFDPAYPQHNFPVDENNLVSPVMPLVATMFAVFFCGMGVLVAFVKSKASGACAASAHTCCSSQPKQ